VLLTIVCCGPTADSLAVSIPTADPKRRVQLLKVLERFICAKLPRNRNKTNAVRMPSIYVIPPILQEREGNELIRL
jgi:hypothetical protein